MSMVVPAVNKSKDSRKLCFECSKTIKSKEPGVSCAQCHQQAHSECYQNTAKTQTTVLCPKCNTCVVCNKSEDKPECICQQCHKMTHLECLKRPPRGDYKCSDCLSSKQKTLKQKKPSKSPTKELVHQVKLQTNTVAMKRSKSAPAVVKSPKYTLQSVLHSLAENTSSEPAYFGKKLTLEQANTQPCTPGLADRQYFEASLEPTLPMLDTGDGESYVALPKMPKIQIGEYTIDTWYAAPYPQEYNVLPCLFLCEFCFKYMKSEFGLKRHMLKCTTRHPPGDEIYREGNISVFEVDGRKHKIYCQNLCLLSKIFLDHKTLYYDVEPFLFYIMTEQTETGAHFVGYFSKEKRSLANYNVSCILTLPIHQRKGYGNFLIQFSYLLTSKEDKYGSPEKPLSDLGLLSYRHYWRTAVVNAILDLDDDLLTIDDIMTKTRMTADDVVHTLFLMNMLHKNAKGDYVLVKNKQALLEYKDKILAKGYIQVKPELLQWDPVLFNRIE